MQILGSIVLFNYKCNDYFLFIYVGACFIREPWRSEENILSKPTKPGTMSCPDT